MINNLKSKVKKNWDKQGLGSKSRGDPAPNHRAAQTTCSSQDEGLLHKEIKTQSSPQVENYSGADCMTLTENCGMMITEKLMNFTSLS